MGERRRYRVRRDPWGLLIVALAAALGAFGIWHLPAGGWNVDYLHVAQSMAVNGFEPGYYKHPSLYFDLVALLYTAAYAWQLLVGAVADRVGFVQDFFFEPGPFLVLGRLVSLLAFLMLVAAVVRIGRRLWGAQAGHLAGLVAATSPALLHFAQAEWPDMLHIAVGVVLVERLLELRARPTTRNYLRAGFWLGLGLASKYPFLAFGLPCLWTHIAALRGGARQRVLWRRAGLATLAAAGAFLLACPYVLLHPQDYFGGFFFQAGFATEASEARELRALDSLYYLRYLAHGAPLAFFVGLPGLVWRAVRGDDAERMIGGFAVVVIVFFHLTSTWADRWILPSVPFLCLFAGWTLSRVARLPWLVARRWWVSSAAVVAALVVAALSWIAPVHQRLGSLDPRRDASAWVLAHVPPPATVIAEPDLLDLRSPELERARLKSFVPAGRDRWAPLARAAFDREAKDPSHPGAGLRFVDILPPDPGVDIPSLFVVENVAALRPEWVIIERNHRERKRALAARHPERHGHFAVFYDWLEAHYVERARFPSDSKGRGIVVSIQERR